MNNLKPIIAKHFDYSSREKGGQFFCGEFFSPKHESSLEDLIADLEPLFGASQKEVERLEDELEKAELAISNLKDGIKEAIDDIDTAEMSTDWPYAQTAMERLSKINDEN